MFWIPLGGTLNTQATPSNERSTLTTAGLWVAGGLIALLLVNWLSQTLSDWLSWPLIIAGALAFALGKVFNNKNIMLIATALVLTGVGLFVLDWSSGLLLRLIKIFFVVAVLLAVAVVAINLARSKK